MTKLYIIIREDIFDLTPGKAIAQAAHAVSDFEHHEPNSGGFWGSVQDWCEDRKFGTTVVLRAEYSRFEEIEASTLHNGIILDESYPFTSYTGKRYTMPMTTCMWVFATQEEELEFMKQFPLYEG